MSRRTITVDANEAVANIAYQINEVIAIYPITPSSPMGESADAWSAVGRKNLFGQVPDVIEMQSEGGAAGALHGSLQAGALTTTFTASQGLLLMIPNMFKIAGELTPTVIHVAARTLATHCLSIFGDHSDVMACRSCGWTMLCSNSVQEAQDFALISHAAALNSRVPVLHFFDGFRTSHEVNKIEELEPDDLRAMLDFERIRALRDAGLSPDRPVLRGTAQNPDVFFQAREACNPYYLAVPGIVQQTMDQFAKLTGRAYKLYEYVGHPQAERVVVLMGSGCGAAEEAVEALLAKGEKVGMIKVRLYRPFFTAEFLKALPATVKRIGVLDRTKEPGAIGEPLYQDVVTALAEGWNDLHANTATPSVYGGRYGLSSKEFTPAMVAAVFTELTVAKPKRGFTVGIIDDVTHLSLKHDPAFDTEEDEATRAVFFGLGSDGTVGANKNSVKIVGEGTPLYAQGYFVYDSKKAGSTTVSHLRFGPKPIRSTYLIQRANFVACHQFNLLERIDMLSVADRGATFLLNSPYDKDAAWDQLPQEVQEAIIAKQLKFYVIDAVKIAREAGLGTRINTVMQVCFFKLANILPEAQALEAIRKAIKKTYDKRGESVVRKNLVAVDSAIQGLFQVEVPKAANSQRHRIPPVPANAPDFVSRVTAMMIAGQGDLLPVSALPVDGTFPTGTACFEKRSIAIDIPIWDEKICTQCGLCPLVCPHAAIRMKVFSNDAAAGAPETFRSKPWNSKDIPGDRMTIQVAPEDCTGCGVCVDICPAKSKEVAKHKAINMRPKLENLDVERSNFDFLLKLPELDRTTVKMDSVKGSQTLLPLFEYSGACSGCGETPYLKLISQLFGDRMVVANATGCSSIYGGNLPTTPWTKDANGRGPAWCNSLFEDNAEFGLGMRLALDQQKAYAKLLVPQFAKELGDNLVTGLLTASCHGEKEIREQRERIVALKTKLAGVNSLAAKDLLQVADALVDRSVWIIGGDGWAYDIGFGGLDHVMASGRNVNIIVLDTGVYSNTGGQASKATPLAAVAKFASSGKKIPRKDLGMIAMAYGNVYVGQLALGANPLQTIRTIHEAESYPGPSLLLAYSHCIAHGIDMETGMSHQKDVVNSGFWPLYHFDPRAAVEGDHPFKLDSRKPTIPFEKLAESEGRFAMLKASSPEEAARLHKLAQKEIDDRWRLYEQMATVERNIPVPATDR